MNDREYRVAIQGAWQGIREERIPPIHQFVLPTGTDALDRVNDLKHDYWAKVGKPPTKLVTWHKFYKELAGALARYPYAPPCLPKEVLGMEICLVPVPITYVCGNADEDFTVNYREWEDGDTQETG